MRSGAVAAVRLLCEVDDPLCLDGGEAMSFRLERR